MGTLVDNYFDLFWRFFFLRSVIKINHPSSIHPMQCTLPPFPPSTLDKYKCSGPLRAQLLCLIIDCASGIVQCCMRIRSCPTAPLHHCCQWHLLQQCMLRVADTAMLCCALSCMIIICRHFCTHWDVNVSVYRICRTFVMSAQPFSIQLDMSPS